MAIGTSNQESNIVEEYLDIADTKEFIVPFKDVTFMKMIKLVPIISKQGSEEEFCVDQSIMVLRIPDCQ